MPNTFNAALVQDAITSATLKKLPARLAALRVASTDFSTDVKKPGEVVRVAVATAGSTTQVNPSTFNSIGGTTVGAEAVTLEHLQQPFGLSFADLQNGHKLERLIGINLDKLADKIWEKFTTPLTVANFGAAVATAADSSFTPGSAQLKALWAGVSKSRSKALITNAGIYSNLIPTSTTSLALEAGAYGFEKGVFYASSFSGEAKLAAVAIDESAIAIASAQPSLDHVRGNFLVDEAVTLPDLGITIYWNVYTDMSTRNLVASAELMFGAAAAVKVDSCALALNP